MIRRTLWLVLYLLLPVGARAGAIDAPPAILAMWDGKDGASVRATLHSIVALGERPGATARQRLESGEAAWWLGVQDERAARPDSAILEWRRAVKLRADFDEGFALIGALLRSGRRPALDEAYGLAVSYVDMARMDTPARRAESQAWLAWALQLRGQPDSALAAVRDAEDAIRPKPAWTRSLATIEHAAGDHAQAWKSLTLLSARTRQQDAAVESLVVLTQKALGYIDERRENTVAMQREAVESRERHFTTSLNVGQGAARAADGFDVRWFEVPAARGLPARTPLLLVLAANDSLVAADSLAAAFAAAGHAVVLLPPRGAYNQLGRGAYEPQAWAGRPAALTTTVAGDAAQVMAVLAKRAPFASGGWIVGATGDAAPTALAIARARKDTKAMLLVAPRLPLVEVAEYRARLRTLKTRTFIQVSPEEPSALEVADLISRQTNPGQVRVADSGDRGRGMAIFRAEPKIAQRLLDWLEEKR